MSPVIRELNLFFVALTFLTRLPAPAWVKFETDCLNSSARYFPLVGALVGVIVALAYLLLMQLFNQELCIVLSMGVSVLVTGAFHEDGFADSCDGFGGGTDKQQILAIMKDSQVGTYGLVGLGLLMATKFYTLASFPAQSVAVVLVFAHAISRLVSVSLLYSHEYVQDTLRSKVKPLATSLSAKALLFAVISVVPLLVVLSAKQLIVTVMGLMLLRYVAGIFLFKRIGGYTGDCLGAVQQLAEVLIYLLLLVCWPVS